MSTIGVCAYRACRAGNRRARKTGGLLIFVSAEAMTAHSAASARGCGCRLLDVRLGLGAGELVFGNFGDPLRCFGPVLLLGEQVRVPVLELRTDVEACVASLLTGCVGTIGGIGLSSSSATSGAHSPVAVRRSRCRLSYVQKSSHSQKNFRIWSNEINYWQFNEIRMHCFLNIRWIRERNRDLDAKQLEECHCV